MLIINYIHLNHKFIKYNVLEVKKYYYAFSRNRSDCRIHKYIFFSFKANEMKETFLILRKHNLLRNLA